YVFAYGGDQVKVTTNMENASLTTCVNCHNGAGVGQVQAAYSSNGQQFKAKINVYNAWTASNHKTAGVVCYTCHVGADSGAHPGVVAANVCTPCHGTTVPSMNADAAHTATAGGSTPSAGCIGCHNVGQNAGAAYVQDNNGVRAITTEFTKWSHHVTGVTLQNAHCAACHLEGKVQDGVIVTDPAYHMVDAKTHLRNADTNADIQWDPAAPSHSNMDNFCMSCHDSNGATGIAAIQAVMIPATGKTASASNPFGDTISNQYDHLERPAVVDAAGQFATGNPSHHAVLGKKYSGRSRVSKGGTIVDAAFTANSSATNPGKRSTIFDAGKFTATYTTLADAVGESGARNGGTSLGDDSTLHCGDCHTVGQFRAADVNVAPFNKVVIGAHGSNNEYMLRNNAGTDVRHTTNFRTDGVNGFVAQDGNKPYLVCYNCHAIAAYGLNVAHAGEHDTTSISRGSDCNGPLNTNAATGEARLIAQSSGGATPTIPKAGTEYGNMFGIQCAACHNSGVKGNIFGGIHGSKEQTYTDGAGNTTKHRRFMPGLNNAMFVPGTLGGVTGGTTATYTNYSSNWLTGDALRYTAKAVNNNAYVLNPVDAALAAGRKAHNGTPSYTYQTGGVTNDLNWEQWKAQPIAGALYAGNTPMGCYTVSPNPTGPVAGAASAWSAAVPTSNYQSASTTTAGSRAAIAAPTGVVSQPVIAKLAVDGYPADDVRYSASYELTAGDGREVFETWGGCDDHNGAKGAGTSPTRNVLRPATY
ncbi:MAG: hypothetical protein WCL71_01365, partial [Deltaproteobacteria bacterium]